MGSQMAPVQTLDKGAHPIAAPREERRIPFRTENHENAPEERGRSRKRRRGGDDHERCNEEEGNNSGTAEGSPTGGTPRKRRRSRKGLDKKFDCPHENCGKSYSRAEHLYRHQLNRKHYGHDICQAVLTLVQIRPRRSIIVISLNALGFLYAKISVLATVTGTLLEARNCRGKTSFHSLPARVHHHLPLGQSEQASRQQHLAGGVPMPIRLLSPTGKIACQTNQMHILLQHLDVSPAAALCPRP